MLRKKTTLALCLILSLGLIATPVRAAWLDEYVGAKSEQWVNFETAPTPDMLKGRFYLLDFWTYCCINCIQALPMVKQIQQDFAADITVIGVHSGKFSNERSALPIARAIARYGINYPVFNDDDYTIWKHFDIKGWPSLVLLNPDGEIAWRYFGEAPYDLVKKNVEAALASYKDKAFNKLPLAVKPAYHDKPQSRFYYPSKLIPLGAGDYALSDSGHDRVVILDDQFNITAEYAGFNAPQGLAYDAGNDVLYVADTGHHQIKRITLKDGAIETIAGQGKRGAIFNGQRQDARISNLASPWDITFWLGGLAIANAGTHQLLALDTEDSSLRAIAGNGREFIDDGLYPQNSLSQPSALAAMGDVLYFLDSETSSLRRMDKNGQVTTLIGKGLFDFGAIDGTKDTARMQHPLGLAADVQNNRLFIADSYNQIIRLYDIESGYLQTISGKPSEMEDLSAEGTGLRYHEPNDIVVQQDGSLLIVDTNNHRLVRYNPFSDVVKIYR